MPASGKHAPFADIGVICAISRRCRPLAGVSLRGVCQPAIPTARRSSAFLLDSGLIAPTLALEQGMQALQIERQADQTPLATGSVLAAQRELAEAHDLL